MSEKTNKRDIKQTLSLIGRGLRHLLLHNGWLKLIAILISVFLWAGLISQDESITRDKAFQDIKVTVTGQETMKNNGFIVTTDLSDLTVDFVAAVPQKQYDKVDASNYAIRLDLSRINKTGTQEVRIQPQMTNTSMNLYGSVKENSITPSTITVDVENYMPRTQIPLSAVFDDPQPEDWQYTQASCDPAVIDLIGPAKDVEDVSRAIAHIYTDDIIWEEGQYSERFPFKLYTRNGQEVNTENVSISSLSTPIDHVIVEYTIKPKKNFKTDGLANIIGNPAKGYTISDITYTPETISIVDSSEVLDKLDELLIEDATINVNGLKGNKVFPLKVMKPSDKSELNTETIMVTVVIDEIQEP
ncbi:MAG: hypothetical protein IKZ98_13365 [Clostridia bacterium]|nr:hypothetical protein [Clostridia bacterium]